MRFVRRRLLLAALASAFALGLGGTAPPPPAVAAPEVITLKPQRANAYWNGIAWAVPLNVSGRAKRGSQVSVTATCAIGTCTASAVTGSNGRWSIGFDPIVKARSSRLLLRVLVDGRELRRTFDLVAPDGSGPRSRGVMVVGDSLAQGTAGTLPAQLPGRFVTTQARGGRLLASGLRVFNHTPIDRRIQVVVFSLFTNDDPRSVLQLRSAVRSTMKRLGSRRCAVWYTVRRPKVGGVSYKNANDALHALAAEPAYAGRLLIVPWYETISDNKRLLTRDRVHATAAGNAVRAQLTAEAVKRCGVAPR